MNTFKSTIISIAILVVFHTTVTSSLPIVEIKPMNIPHLIGGCESTEFRCCHDNTTACSDSGCSNCNHTYTSTTMVEHLIGGCESTEFRCCHDNTTACSDSGCSNCNHTYTITYPITM